MSVTAACERPPASTPVFDCLTDPRRRAMLATVVEAGSPIPVDELAETVADRDDDAVSASDPQVVAAAFEHLHLPELATLDLVTWDREAATVAPGDHDILTDDRFRTLLCEGEGDWAVAATVLADPCRRAAVDVLEATDGTTSRTALAERLAADEQLPDADRLEIELHHVHLPKLESVDLLAYDDADGTVRADGAFEVPLLAAEDGAN